MQITAMPFLIVYFDKMRPPSFRFRRAGLADISGRDSGIVVFGRQIIQPISDLKRFVPETIPEKQLERISYCLVRYRTFKFYGKRIKEH